MTKPITVREACRRKMPLDGADAQALEHALTMTERERDAAYAELNKQRPAITAIFDRNVWDAAKKKECLEDTGSGTFPGGGPYEDVRRTAYVAELEKKLADLEKRLKEKEA